MTDYQNDELIEFAPEVRSKSAEEEIQYGEYVQDFLR